jgi:hypothetical protein
MKMHDVDRSDLTIEEREVVGSPGDLVSENSIPARSRSSSVMVSLRIDRRTFDDLTHLAEQGGQSFSELVRDALRNYGRTGGVEQAYPIQGSRLSGSARRVSERHRLSWDDDDLRAALERYESACRNAGMRENAWRSYVDYARRFVAWRRGDYLPRGVDAGGRPVPRTPASTTDLRPQAELYARQVEAAGRQQPTVDTYFRHAMFFIRWLDGDFQPGARLRGLR